MKFTGERFIPTEQGAIRLEHYHRYALVLDIVKGKKVLDIACGEGYGSSMIARSAHSVIGVDISHEAVEHASKTYANQSNLRFLCNSASSVDLPDASFDVVVSFETIEHLTEQQEMLAELRRVLKPDGVLIMSSPNRPVYFPMRLITTTSSMSKNWISRNSTRYCDPNSGPFSTMANASALALLFNR